MKSKYEIIKVLNILRINTDPWFKPEVDIGFHYDDKITKLEKLRYLHEISILKWVLTDYDYDDNDMKKSNNDEDLTWELKPNQ